MGPAICISPKVPGIRMFQSNAPNYIVWEIKIQRGEEISPKSRSQSAMLLLSDRAVPALLIPVDSPSKHMPLPLPWGRPIMDCGVEQLTSE